MLHAFARTPVFIRRRVPPLIPLVSQPALEPASLLRRVAALTYDLLLLAALIFSFTLAVLALRLGAAIPAGTLWFEGCLLAIALLFFCGFWVHGGQTLGMRAWRIRIVCDDGATLRWPRAIARFAAAIVAVLPAGLGFWWGAFDRSRRCWHDRLTRTRVVRVGPQPRRD